MCGMGGAESADFEGVIEAIAVSLVNKFVRMGSVSLEMCAYREMLINVRVRSKRPENILVLEN